MQRFRVLLASAALSATVNLAQADVKIGVGAPVTGPNASFGEQVNRGARQAAEDFNATGGLLGQKIEMAVGDDVSDPKQGVAVANKFVGDGVKLVIGHFNSGVTIPASEVYADNGVLFVSPSATNPKVTERGLWNAFRTCGRDDQQAKVWADYILKNLKDKRIAILHDKTPYGQGLAEEARKNLNAAGKTEVIYEGVNVGEKDYSAIAAKVKASGADYVMWGGLYTEGGLILRQLRDQGGRAVFISGDGIANQEFSAIAGPDAEGALMTFGSDPQSNPAATEVVAEFKKTGYEPAGYTLYAYAGMQILKAAAEKANSLEPKKLAEIMHSGMTFKTVLGDISYDKKGDRTNVDYVWYVWKKDADGKITYKPM